MSTETMTAMERTQAAMSQQEPDCVPLFLATTLHGARELGMSLESYFSDARNVVEGQTRLYERYRGDCLNPVYYAALETEAWGGTTIYLPDGPPQCGRPIIGRPGEIDELRAPSIDGAAGLQRMLATIAGLKARFGDSVPIVGVAIAPFSLPVLQMGFAAYLDLLHEEPERQARLMAVNEEFCVAWANAQLEAGATAIGYADPVSSTTIVARAMYERLGHPVACRTIARIRGPVAVHLASGCGLGIADLIAATGAVGVGVSAREDLGEWKRKVNGRLTLLGNLNGIEMRHWRPEQTEQAVKQVIARAGRGGGLLLSDNHGELPWQTPDAVLHALRAAVDRWGRYPLEWIEQEEQPQVK